MIANADDTFFSIPNTLITARKPVVPVSNLSSRPRYIRKGEIVGELTDPGDFFDVPRSDSDVECLQRKTALISAIIHANLEKDRQRERDPGKTEERGQKEELSKFPKKEMKDSKIRTDFGSGVPPMEENILNGVHVRDAEGHTLAPYRNI
ncbi:hypothetical protein B0H13DRAFT_1914903 [Mycena leptocephala]|nr:hypothetical protein B0H13DRAFT_1914903 [Mycena leptocephala]